VRFLLLLSGRAGTVEVAADAMQGRTEAAIAEFRAAVGLEPRLDYGAALFITCATCHRADGSGSRDGTIPVIAGQHVSVLVKQLVDFRHDRRWNERMRDASKMHSLETAQDLLDVSAYAESLPRPTPRPRSVDVKGRNQGRSSTIATARAVMDGSAKATCVRCGRAWLASTMSTCCASSPTRPPATGRVWTRRT
jgi:cytochrome c553